MTWLPSIGAMESMRATWTDTRLDELNGHVISIDQRLRGVEQRVVGLEQGVEHVDRRVDELGHRMDAGFARVDGEMRAMRGEIGSLNRTMLQVGGGMIGTLVVGICGLIATQI